MREITVKLYEFSELNEDTQKKVLQTHWNINVFDIWWSQFLRDRFKAMFKALNIDLSKNQSNNYFYFDIEDRPFFSYDSQVKLCDFVEALNAANWGDESYLFAKLPIEEWQEFFNSPSVKRLVKLNKKGFICFYADTFHDHTTTNLGTNYGYEIYTDNDLDNTKAKLQEIGGMFRIIFKSISQICVQELTDEYNYQTSEEQIINSINANEYEFYPDGTIYVEN